MQDTRGGARKFLLGGQFYNMWKIALGVGLTWMCLVSFVSGLECGATVDVTNKRGEQKAHLNPSAEQATCTMTVNYPEGACVCAGLENDSVSFTGQIKSGTKSWDFRSPTSSGGTEDVFEYVSRSAVCMKSPAKSMTLTVNSGGTESNPYSLSVYHRPGNHPYCAEGNDFIKQSVSYIPLTELRPDWAPDSINNCWSMEIFPSESCGGEPKSTQLPGCLNGDFGKVTEGIIGEIKSIKIASDSKVDFTYVGYSEEGCTGNVQAGFQFPFDQVPPDCSPFVGQSVTTVDGDPVGSISFYQAPCGGTPFTAMLPLFIFAGIVGATGVIVFLSIGAASLSGGTGLSKKF